MIYRFNEQNEDELLRHHIMIDSFDKKRLFYEIDGTLKLEVYEWLNEMIPAKWDICVTMFNETYYVIFKFINEVDALAFMLRWQ